MSSISDGTTTITPILITGWQTARDGGNVLHNIIDRADDEVTFHPATLRTGELEALVLTLEAALTLETLLAKPQKLTLTDADHPGVNMTFVVPEGGSITVTLDDETRELATVAWDFAQVSP